MGPLAGVRVIEMAGLGPAPLCGMLLADLGAEVVLVDRSREMVATRRIDPIYRNRRGIALNLKNPAGIEVLLGLAAKADILIECFRPGVMERLGAGPDACLARNPRLVYGRMTGWGQDGPLARSATHDINYLALTGLLHQIGPVGGRPVPPEYFVGDFGAGGAMLAIGVLAALTAARVSGRGQVVDAAIVYGAIAMMGVLYALRGTPLVRDATGENYLAGAAPWYDTYATKDGRYVSVGALEPQFFGLLLDRLGLDRGRWAPLGFPNVGDEARREWPALRAAMAAAFASRTRDEWCGILEGSDACFAPVLSMAEAPGHPHNVARGSFIEVDGVLQHAPAPRFSGTPPGPVRPPPAAGADTDAVLRDGGWRDDQIAALRDAGALD